MSEFIALEHALLASIIGMTLICSVVALAIGAGYWLLDRQRRINLEQIEQQRQDEWYDDLVIRWHVGEAFTEQEIADRSSKREEGDTWSL